MHVIYDMERTIVVGCEVTPVEISFSNYDRHIYAYSCILRRPLEKHCLRLFYHIRYFTQLTENV
jgi:hypothetical protein